MMTKSVDSVLIVNDMPSDNSLGKSAVAVNRDNVSILRWLSRAADGSANG